MDPIDNILAKHLTGLQLTIEEEKELILWRKVNELEYQSISKTIHSTEVNGSVKFDTRKAWDKMDAKIDGSTKTFSLKPILKYAIAASIAIIIGIGGFNMLKSTSIDFILIQNDNISNKTVELPDGSEVILAKNSILEYNPDFKNSRDLKLKGEAFFEVYRDESHPFIIKTMNGDVAVLGTSFNVNTFDNKTKVDVKTGLVALRNNGAEIKLTVNESAWSDSKQISNKENVDQNYLSWQTGLFNFENTSLSNVINDLESFYGNIIDLEDLKECTFSGSFNNQKIEDILEALALSCNLELTKFNNRFQIK